MSVLGGGYTYFVPRNECVRQLKKLFCRYMSRFEDRENGAVTFAEIYTGGQRKGRSGFNQNDLHSQQTSLMIILEKETYYHENALWVNMSISMDK